MVAFPAVSGVPTANALQGIRDLDLESARRHDAKRLANRDFLLKAIALGLQGAELGQQGVGQMNEQQRFLRGLQQQESEHAADRSLERELLLRKQQNEVENVLPSQERQAQIHA